MAGFDVSVVLPVFNGERFIRAAVASLAAQTRQPDQLVIVDDGSTDATPDLLPDAVKDLPWNVRLLRTVNSGPAAARNAGIAESSGDAVAFLDVDDLWLPDFLNDQLQHLDRHRWLDYVVSGARIEADGGSRSLQQIQQIQRWRAARDGNHLFVFGAGLFRRDVFRRAGEISPELRFGEDLDFYLRLSEAPDIHGALAPETGYVYRLHDTNMTLDSAAAHLAVTRVIKRSLDRRRGPDGIRPLPPLELLPAL
ncbi:glycosyltransferase family 2 protein [Azospirillum endophyticum]